MNIINTFFVNSKKLKNQTGKAFFLIIPIVALVALSIVVSSQVTNIKEATNEVVFGTIEEQSRMIELNVDTSVDDRNPAAFFNPEEQEFTEADLSNIASIENVEAASIQSSILISNISSDDTFHGISYDISDVVGIDPSIAALYTSEDFTYTEGEAIPIVLNASTFMESYEDWGGETEFTIEFEEFRGRGPQSGEQPTEPVEQIETPFKRRAIDYDEEDLIGKEITISFGGLDEITNYTTERSEDGMVMTLLSDEELAELEAERKDIINDYWNYSKISTPLTYTFVIVDIIEEDQDKNTYIPSEFADVVMSDWIQNQIDARNNTEIPTDDLNTTYTGLTYDGLNLDSGTFSRRGGPGGMGMGPGRPGDTEEESNSYRIPGLVIELSDDGTEDVLGTYNDKHVYEEAVETGRTIIIKTSSFSDRSSIIEALNDAGYAYQDASNLETIGELEQTLDKVRSGLIISFIVLTITIIIITMSKFVSDSTKEIGIFRSIGVTKGGIFTLFILQSLLYTLVGYGVGVGVGILANIGLSGIVNSWFNNTIVSSIEESYNVVNTINSSIFTGIDWSSAGIFTGLLFFVVFVISLIPATKASSISPVEAMKSE